MSETIEEAAMESGLEERAVWSTAYMNDLPDSAFLYVENGDKDSEGKTVPRSKRHFPYKDASGNVDLAHLRNALARIPQANLSAEVKAAATKKAQAILAKQDGRTDADDEYELRYATAPVTHVDVREPGDTGDGSWTMSGYAAVFNHETILHDGSLTRVTEAIDPHAFDHVLQAQGLSTRQGVIHLNIGHDMNRCVAATDVPAGQPGSLQLRADPHGLFFLARVPTDDPDGIALASKLRSGVYKQASFAFRVARAEESSQRMSDGRWQDHQRIMDISRVRDVCITGQGAYSETEAQLRTMAAALGEPVLETGRHPRELALGHGAVEPVMSDGGAARKKPVEGILQPQQLQHRSIK
jgi:HK97 family phage prohead protease